VRACAAEGDRDARDLRSARRWSRRARWDLRSSSRETGARKVRRLRSGSDVRRFRLYYAMKAGLVGRVGGAEVAGDLWRAAARRIYRCTPGPRAAASGRADGHHVRVLDLDELTRGGRATASPRSREPRVPACCGGAERIVFRAPLEKESLDVVSQCSSRNVDGRRGHLVLRVGLAGCAAPMVGATAADLARARDQANPGATISRANAPSAMASAARVWGATRRLLGPGGLPEYPRSTGSLSDPTVIDPQQLQIQQQSRPAGAGSRDPFRNAQICTTSSAGRCRRASPGKLKPTVLGARELPAVGQGPPCPRGASPLPMRRRYRSPRCEGGGVVPPVEAE